MNPAVVICALYAEGTPKADAHARMLLEWWLGQAWAAQGATRH